MLPAGRIDFYWIFRVATHHFNPHDGTIRTDPQRPYDVVHVPNIRAHRGNVGHMIDAAVQRAIPGKTVLHNAKTVLLDPFCRKGKISLAGERLKSARTYMKNISSKGMLHIILIVSVLYTN